MSNPRAASLNKHKLLSLVSLSRTFFDLDWGGGQGGKTKPQALLRTHRPTNYIRGRKTSI